MSDAGMPLESGNDPSTASAAESLHAAPDSPDALRRIVGALSRILARTTLCDYATGVLDELTAIFGFGPDCMLLCNAQPGGLLTAQAGQGLYADAVGRRPDELGPSVVDLVMRARRTGQASDAEATAYALTTTDDRDAIVLFRGATPLGEAGEELMRVLASYIGAGIENVTLVERLQQMVYSDDLTGLPNRSGVFRRLKTLTANERETATLAMLYIDRFTEVNDALGHRTGDELLRQIAARLKQVVGKAELGRVGAGLFSILGPDDAIFPDQIVAQFEEPVEAGGYQVPVSVHLGLARVRETEVVGSDAFKGASIAVNNARRDTQQAWQYYAQSQELEGRERLELLQGLRAALDQDELIVFYQPQLDLATNQVIGAEALIRWRRSNGEYVSPGKFIPLAEYSGLIIPIGDWVLRSACRQVAEWQRIGLPKLRIGVNVSSQQFQREHYVQSVESALRDTGVDPEWIELEVTESAAMADVRSVIAVLHDLRSLGVTLAVDDFGTGYSSLSYLHQLPVHRLKVDQSFVMEMTADEGHGIPKMVIDLAHQLGLTAIAEGVTNQVQADVLRGLGCEEGQGFFYSRPVDAEAYVEWVRNYRAG
ncbi:MAG: EAL domain-containing protein [Armatimonadetes bacterium]|nr:EAL domain-containing protein [Armatimonadota bacterium]